MASEDARAAALSLSTMTAVRESAVHVRFISTAGHTVQTMKLLHASFICASSRTAILSL